MFKKIFLPTLVITFLLSASYSQSFALSPHTALDSALINLAYQNIDSIVQVINDDQLLILGEVYTVNNLILENMQHIDYAQESDVSRIVELFGRIREQDSWGFDPGNTQAEEESFLKMIQNNPDFYSRTSVVNKKIFDLKKENGIMTVSPRVTFKEKKAIHYILVYRGQYQKVQGYIHLKCIKQADELDISVSEIVVDKNQEGNQIAKALSLSALKKIEEDFKDIITIYRISGVSANEKIYGKRGLATKTGFQKLNTGFDIKLLKEINFSPFRAIQTLQSI